MKKCKTIQMVMIVITFIIAMFFFGKYVINLINEIRPRIQEEIVEVWYCSKTAKDYCSFTTKRNSINVSKFYCENYDSHGYGIGTCYIKYWK